MSKHPVSEVPPASVELGLERIVFFSDAVMAIAITLLAIDIKVPEIAASAARSELPARLSELSPQIMSFVISFVVVGIYWMSHHRYFGFIQRYDRWLMLLNLLFLLFIAAMPFSTGLLGQFAYLPLGVIVYAADVVAIGLSLSALWGYASHGHRLVDPALDPRLIRTMSVRAFVAPMVFLLSIPIGLTSPFGAMVTWWVSPIIALVAVRLVERGQARRRRRSPGDRG
jgi:uncharacterized membrane protein